MSRILPGTPNSESPAPMDSVGVVGRGRRLNLLCDLFENAWRTEPRPVIEEFLDLTSESERDELLRELIGLEIEFRRRAGERPTLEEYCRRFTDHEALVRSCCDSSIENTGPPGMTLASLSPRKPGMGDLDPFIGKVLAARYEINCRLGGGGMGTVYQAKQHPLDRWVALKMIRAELARDPLAARRFHREMRAAVRIEHPNIVRVYDYGMAESGELYMVMEYLDGRTLSSALEEHRKFDAARIDHIGLQIAKALAAAQTEGVIHRDLKPQNIVLLDHYGDHDSVKVLDFGLARFNEPLASEDQTTLTSDGMLIGSPHYMAPEQIAGETVDQRVDLYALGVLLYRMTTGQELFSGKTAAMVVAKHLTETPQNPSTVAGSPVPTWLEKLILQLLEKDPSKRPQTAEEVIQLFDRSQMKVPVPANEEARLQALRQLRILDTDPEQVFDDLTLLASYICGTPLAAISLVDEDRQWFKSKVGMSTRETSRNISFCTHTILGNELFMVTDATQDKRFAESPLVQNNPQVRFYAGMPLTTTEGHNIGALCVMDNRPNQLNAEQITALSALSRLVQAQLELRRDLMLLKEQCHVQPQTYLGGD